jgi:excisionase family DNA binding protein
MSADPQRLRTARRVEPGLAPSKLDELLTADEVAELLRVPRSTVSDYARRGVLPSIKIGRHRRFVRSDVASAIERLR